MDNSVTEPGVVVTPSTDPAVGRPMYRTILIAVAGSNPAIISWAGVRFELQGGDTVGFSNQRIKSPVSAANVDGQPAFERVSISVW